MSRKVVSFRFAPFSENQSNMPQVGAPMTYKGKQIGKVIKSSEVEGVVTAEVDAEHVPMFEEMFKGLGVFSIDNDEAAN